MKKISIMIAFLAFTALSCDNKRTDEPPAEPAPEPVRVEPEPDNDKTTIKINEEGASYESKDGDKESNINIGGDSTSIEISKPN